MADIEVTVPGKHWHDVQPYRHALVLWSDRDDGGRIPLAIYDIDTAEQDDAPYGPVRVTAHRREVS